MRERKERRREEKGGEEMEGGELTLCPSFASASPCSFLYIIRTSKSTTKYNN